jgi:hypothetical protein
MAQKKTQNTQKSSKSSAKRSGGGAKPRAATRSAPAAKRTPTATKRSGGNGSAPKSRRSSSSSSRRSSRGSANGGPVASARDSVVDGAQSAGRTVGSAASDAGRAVGSAANAAKVPAVAGAALAGLVGGVALARGGRRRVLGVPVPGTRRPLVKINGRGSGTKQLMKTGRQVAELAVEVRQARQQLATERRRSPIEVVLDGLTARRGRDAAK